MHNLNTALVTGASSGIGYAFAKELAKEGKYNLLLVARREERLKTLCKEIETLWSLKENRPSVSYLIVDLRNRSAIDELIKYVEEKGIFVELLINNAGYGSVKSFLETDIDWLLNMVELNVKAAMHLCHAFLPAMCKKRSGAIINVCSTASFQPMAYMATYAASKSFLRNFSLALNAEVKKDNVLVMAHCPGPTESEFHIVAGLGEKISYLKGISVEAVAKETLSGIKSRTSLLINGFNNKLLAVFATILPLRISAALVERVLRRHGR